METAERGQIMFFGEFTSADAIKELEIVLNSIVARRPRPFPLAPENPMPEQGGVN